MLENRLAAIAAPSISRTRVDELPSRQRARRTNDPLAEIGTNTARGRRVADLVRAYLRALGNPANIEQQAAVIAAAELQVLAEEARGAALKETGRADLDQVIRVQGAADRAVRALGLDRKREPEATESFATIAAMAQADANERRAKELADDEASAAADAAVEAETVSGSQVSADEETLTHGHAAGTQTGEAA